MEEKKPKRQSAAPKKAAAPKKDSAPKKAVAKKATSPKAAAKTSTRKKAEPKTPFWAPFAKPEEPRPAPLEERSFRKSQREKKEEREERPSRRPASRRDESIERPSRRPAPRKEGFEERPNRRNFSKRDESDERPSRRPTPRRDGPKGKADDWTSSPRKGDFEGRPPRRSAPKRDDFEGRPKRTSASREGYDERPKRSFGEKTERPPRTEGRFSRNSDERQERPEAAGRRFTKPRPSATANAPVKHKPVKLDEPMRLNKYLAHCGVAARRQSAEYVKQGLVTVNGEVEPNPSYPVQPTDEVRYRGEVVKLEERKVYILMNKPKDIITTASDEKGRRTVLDLIGNKVEERIFPVGRLDRNTSGLLLLTNDGDLAEKLAHPRHKVDKVYHVLLDRPFHRHDFEKVQKGLMLDDGIAEVDSLHYVEGAKDELEIGLHIGKNRIVRRIFEHLGYEVVKLDRTYYAGLTKKDIGRGHFRHLTEQEVVMLKHFK